MIRTNGARGHGSRERGASAVEVVGAALLVVAIVTTVALSAEPVGRWIGWKLECVVATMDDVADGDVECGPDPLVVAEGEDGLEGYGPPPLVPDDTGMVDPEHYDELCETAAGYDADEPCHPKEQDCELADDGSVVAQAEEHETVWTVEGRPVLWTGCHAYVPPDSCGPPLTGWDQGTDLSEEDGFAAWRDCVLGTTTGDPDDDPDTEDCRDATPASHGTDPGEPPSEPRVQVGCAVYWVPQECRAEWEAYLEWSGPALQASRAAALRDCVVTTLNGMERDCVVWQKSQGKHESYQVLFWRWSKSRGFVFEKMGDGTIRMHALNGSGKGHGLQFGPKVKVGDTGAKFTIGGYVVSGAETDTTYEFRNLEDAQSWIDWYGEYEKADEKVAKLDHYHNCYWNDCSGKSSKGKGPAFVPKKMWREAMADLEELRGQEPPHKLVQSSGSRTEEREFSIGAELGQGFNGMELGINAEGKFKVKGSIEERDYRDTGKKMVTWTTSDEKGFTVLALLSGTPSKMIDWLTQFGEKGSTFGGKGGGSGGSMDPKLKKLVDGAKAKGYPGGGKTFSGSLSVSAVYNADGTLDQVVYRTTSSTLAYFQGSVGPSVTVNMGMFEVFNLGFKNTRTDGTGTESVVESVVSMSSLTPEQREAVEQAVGVVFPRDEEGALERDPHLDVFGDPEMYDDGEEEEVGSASELLRDAARSGGTRELEYDWDYESESNEVSVDVLGFRLASEKWETVNQEKDLKESSLTYTDVDGSTRTVSPAPKCRMLTKDTAGPSYYDTGSSDPSTGSHPQGQGYYWDVSRTPLD